MHGCSRSLLLSAVLATQGLKVDGIQIWLLHNKGYLCEAEFSCAGAGTPDCEGNCDNEATCFFNLGQVKEYCPSLRVDFFLFGFNDVELLLISIGAFKYSRNGAPKRLGSFCALTGLMIQLE